MNPFSGMDSDYPFTQHTGLFKTFAGWPIKLHTTNKYVWLKTVYYRKMVYDPFGVPDVIEETHYYTPEEATMLVLSGESNFQKHMLPFPRLMPMLMSAPVAMTIALLLIWF